MNIVFLAVLAFLLAVSHVKAVPEPHNPHAGFYIGYNLGYTSINGKLTHDLTISRRKQYASNEVGSNSSTVGIFLGYGWEPSTNIYLGPEIFAQYENIKQNNQILNGETRIEANSSFGAAAKIGYLYKDALFFVKQGVVSMSNKPENISLRKTGFLMGIGLDYAINRNLAIGGEFIYENYKSIKVVTPYGLITYEPKKSTTNIRLKYTF